MDAEVTEKKQYINIELKECIIRVWYHKIGKAVIAACKKSKKY